MLPLDPGEPDPLEDLASKILSCTRCRLHMSRKKAVPGDGSRSAEALLIGEAPGASEDEAGIPFVGPAGRLLESALSELGVSRADVFITNVVKCRPPGNRKPLRDEVEACSPYLEAQIAIIRPRVVITLGNTAGEWVFKRLGIAWKGVTRMRGRIYRGRLAGLEILAAPTYHPAAVLRNRRDLEDFKRDLEQALRGLGRRERRRSLLDYAAGGAGP